MKVATVNQIREIEAAADRAGFSYARMMRAAGAESSAFLQRRRELGAESRVAFLIGKGNNGGDGLVMARELSRATGADIRLYLLEPRDESDENYRAVLDERLPLTFAAADANHGRLRALIESADVIVDALLGIGARPPLRGAAAAVLKTVKAALHQRRRPFILAIDCPSGVDCDSGASDRDVLSADATITFLAAKPGLFTFPAASFVGELALAPLGIPDRLPALDRIKATVADERLAASLLPVRPLDGHKGTYGKVMVVAGSPRYIGAMALAGEAAYRSGAGLVTIAAPRNLVAMVAGALREPTWLPLPDRDGAIAAGAYEAVSEQVDNYDALLVGCGLGDDDSARAFLERLLTRAPLPALIIDADGLNFLSQRPRWQEALPPDTALTPHPGELARLSGISAAAINADRWTAARELAAEWNVALALKGAHTIVAAPDGRASVIPIATDALSTAGSGDVLAGLIAGFRAQGLNGYDSARLGTYLHASAGLIAAEKAGSGRAVIAGDILSALGAAFARLEAR